MTDSRIHELLNKWVSRLLTDKEEAELMHFLSSQESEQHRLKFSETIYKETNSGIALTSEDADRLVREITAHKAMPAAHRIHFLKATWFRYAAAVILLIGIGGYLLWRKSGEIPAGGGNDKGAVVKSGTSSNNKAILTLADGSQIILDDKANGNIAEQGNMKIIKLDGNQLTYNSNLKKNSPPAMEGTVFDPLYNTITTPRGSQYQIILPDGTKAWLNAASSLKFPTTFTGKQRRVEATGEIYFEVSVNKTAPFVVSSKSMEVQVLGTSFNISSYEEEAIKTTLVSGSVKVVKLAQETILKPGQQAIINQNNQPGIVVQKTDIDQTLAWKNGLFNFNGLLLKEVMNQLARWYDVEIIYEGQLPQYGFSGEIGRDLSLNEIIKGLSGMEGVNLRAEGKKLIVSTN